MTDSVHLWGDDLRGLSMQDLLEDEELGERVTWELTMERLAGRYSVPKDREFSMTMLLVSRLAEAGVSSDDERIQQAHAYAQGLDEEAERARAK